jgi:uncharacterized membrane protein YcaP (DUF421 family)
MNDGLPALAAIALRVSVMYAYALGLLRLSGKRNIGQLCGPDLVATIVVGDMFDGMFLGDTPFPEGVVAMTTVVGLHVLVKTIETRSDAVKRALDGPPTLVVIDGAFAPAGLARERTGEANVRELLRLNGIEEIESVREARLEVDGALSVLRHEERKGAQKRDRERLGRLLR